MPKISVIIPCYNQGQFLDEAVDSVLSQTFQDFEIIVVNDGSTDPLTNELLADYRKDKVRVLTTANQGLAAARNNGISQASGTYILPLDADDRIGPHYLEKAVVKLESDPAVGIVYCQARLFGAVETEWNLPEYSLAEMLQDNIIFCTAMFRRRDWERVGGYDPGMIYGWEDYDFWLSLIEKGRRVHQIPEPLFYYRVASDSMVRSKEKWQKVAMFKRIYERHQDLFSQNIEVWIDRLLTAREAYYTSRLYVDTGAGVSDTSSVARKIEPGTLAIDFQTSDFHNIQALRFDPVDSYAIVELDRITLENYHGTHDLDLDRLGSNCCLREANRLYFDSPDPQIFLGCRPEQLNGLVRVGVALRFLALGEDALLQIAGSLRNRLTVLEKENTALKEAGLFQSVLRSLRHPQT